MFFFESTKEKEQRLLIQSRLQICMTNPQRYEQSMDLINSYIRSSDQTVIEMVVNRIKEVIKDQQNQPFVKLQAITLLSDLMHTYNKALGKYVVKKILKRLTIFAEHQNGSKDQERGKNIFGKVSRSQEPYAAKFLNKLLSALEEWGKNWPKAPDGPSQDFLKAYKELLIKEVQFPKEIQRPKKSVSVSPTNTNKINPTPPTKVEIGNDVRNSLINKKVVPSQKVTEHFSNIIQSLNILIEVLNNQEVQMTILWDVVDNIKSTINKGDEHYSALCQNPDQNKVLLQKITESFELLKKLQHDTKIIQRNSSKMQTYKNKYIKNSRIMISSLSFYIGKSSNISISKKQIKPQIPNTANKTLVPQIKPNQPLIKQQNQYQSNKIHIPIDGTKREQFNTNNSQKSNRYGSGSFNGVNPANKFIQNRQNKEDDQINKMSKKQQGIKKKPNIIETSKQDSSNNLQISKGKANQNNPYESNEQIQRKQSNSVSKHTDKQKEIKAQEKDYQKSGEYSEQKTDKNTNKQKDQSSNSQFFQKIEKNPERKKDRKHKKNNDNDEEEKNIFQVNLPSKIDLGLSGFQVTPSRDKKLSSFQINNSNDPRLVIENLPQDQHSISIIPKKKSDIDQNKSPFFQSKVFGSLSNPFISEANAKDKSNINENEKQSQTNSFGKRINNDKQKDISFKAQSQDQQKEDNPFSDKSFEKKSSLSNPFVSETGSKKNKKQNDSKSSQNPFEQKRQIIKNIVKSQKQSVKSENPFDVKSQSSRKSQNPFDSLSKPREVKINGDIRDSLNLAPQRVIQNDGFKLQDFHDVVRNSRASYNQNQTKENQRDIHQQKQKQKMDQKLKNNQLKESVRSSAHFKFEQPNKEQKLFDFDDFNRESSRFSEADQRKSFKFQNFDNNIELPHNNSNLKGYTNKQQPQKSNSSSSINKNQEEHLKGSIHNFFENFIPQNPKEDYQRQKPQLNIQHFQNFDQFNFQQGVKTERSQEFNYSKFQVQSKKQSVRSRRESDQSKRLTHQIEQNNQEKIIQNANLTQPFVSSVSVIGKSNISSNHEKFKKKPEIPQINLQKQQNSISINFDDLAPISKKGILWNPAINIQKPQQYCKLPKNQLTKKYNQLQQKKSIHSKVSEMHKQLKEQYNRKKEKLLKQLGKYEDIVSQKEEYLSIAIKIKENNELKQKNIDELNQKIKKAQILRSKILQKQKLLFEIKKKHNSSIAKTKASNNLYKWEIFNRNLQNNRSNSHMLVSSRTYVS